MISRFSRRFHDPWGNKNGNRYGSPTRLQYVTAVAGLTYSKTAGRDVCDGSIDMFRHNIDRTLNIESVGNKFVKATKRSVERLRR